MADVGCRGVFGLLASCSDTDIENSKGWSSRNLGLTVGVVHDSHGDVGRKRNMENASFS